MLSLVFIFFISQFSWSTALINRYQFLNSQTLPQGVWTFGFNYGQSQGDSSYGSNGQSTSNQNYFSKELNYGHLLDEVYDPFEKELAGAAFKVYGREKSELAGQVINNVSVSQKSNTYILGRGLSDRSGFFVIFPVVTIQTRFSSRFETSDSLNRLAMELQEEGQLSRSREIVEKSENALSQRLSENGYRQTYPSELTTLANIYLNYRYQHINQKKVRLTTDTFGIIPAGKRFDQDDFLPLRINEEQFSFKQAVTASYDPTVYASFLGSLYYHKRFAFNKSQRIPLNSTSPLSNEIDPNTRIRYGDAWGPSAQVNITPFESWTFYIGQSIEYKFTDQYQGNRFSSERYNYLENDTDQKIGMGYLGFSVNTISHFLAKKFILPMDLNLQYSYTNMGKNVFNNKTFGMNLMVFYK